MQLFKDDGCFSDEGLHALIGGQLDELGRLEAAEHLSYCDKCMDRYTALLTADVMQTPPRSARGAVMGTIWVRLMQSTYGRAAVASVAAVLALTMWRTGSIDQLLAGTQGLKTWTPEISQSQQEPEQLGRPVNDDDRLSTQPKTLGQPVQDTAPSPAIAQKLSGALDELLFGRRNPAAEHDAAASNQLK